MGPGIAVLLAACLASAVGQMGGGFRGRGGPPGPPPYPGFPPGLSPGPPPMQPGNYVCCQTAGSPCCQNGQYQGQAVTTPGPWSGYTLSPAAQGSFRGGSNASYYPANWTPPPSLTPAPLFPANVTALAPIGIPDSSILLPNGTVRFPNGTALLTRYATGAVPPVARLPSGILMFANGTIASPTDVTSFPPPGIPLNATLESSSYPPVFLPASSVVFHNGNLASGGKPRIDTVFARGFIYNCLGVTCHHVVLAR